MKDKLFLNVIILAQEALGKLTEDEIQDRYGSDYYHEIKKYLQKQTKKED